MNHYTIEHDGRVWTASEIARVCGLNPMTIRARIRDHPMWGWDKVTQDNTKAKYMVTHDGVTKPLIEWARERHGSYQVALERYRNGVRDLSELFSREKPRLSVRDEDIRWLRDTRKYRIGQEDEWKIACDLIGINRKYAEELRGLVCD